MLKRHIQYKDQIITYYIIKAKTKKLKLTANNSGELQLLIPPKVTIAEAEQIMSQHLRQVYNSWQKIQQRKAMGHYQGEKQYISGDKIRILGNLYTIKWEKKLQNKIFLKDDLLIIYAADNSTREERLNLIKSFLYKQAEKVFSRILKEVYPRFNDYGFIYPHYTIREMKTRWGSCAVNKAKITLNLCLMQVPLKSIEQVIVHELCHFIQPNHSTKFYALMDKHMPDWKLHKQTLDSMGNTNIW